MKDSPVSHPDSRQSADADDLRSHRSYFSRAGDSASKSRTSDGSRGAPQVAAGSPKPSRLGAASPQRAHGSDGHGPGKQDQTAFGTPSFA